MKDTAKEICSRNGIAYAYKCDVSSNDAVKKTANKVRAGVGHPDIVASTTFLHDVSRTSLSDF